MTVRETILSNLTVTGEDVKGKHSPEALQQAMASATLYDQDSSVAESTGEFVPTSFEDLLRTVNIQKTNAAAVGMFLDNITIDDLDMLPVSCQRASNVIISAQKEVDYLSSKMICHTGVSATSIEALQDKSLLNKPRPILRAEKAAVAIDQINKKFSSANIEIGHSIDTDNLFNEKTFSAINEVIANLKSVILFDTLSGIKHNKEELFRIEMLITNNRIIRSLVESAIDLRFPTVDDETKAEYISKAMGAVTDHFDVNALTRTRLDFGIQLARISKSTNPQWTVDKKGRNFRKNGDVAMRILQVSDTYSSVPVLDAKLGDYQDKIARIESSFTKWAEDDTRLALGLKAMYTDYSIPVIEGKDLLISEVLGYSEDDSLKLRAALMKEVKAEVSRVVDQLRKDTDVDTFSGLKERK